MGVENRGSGVLREAFQQKLRTSGNARKELIPLINRVLSLTPGFSPVP